MRERVIAGEVVTYVLKVKNAGPSLAVGVRVTDTLPPATSFVRADPAPTGSLGSLVWDLGQMAVGESQSIEVVILTENTLADGTLLRNLAVVGAETVDPVSENNESTAVAQTGAVADVELHKTAEKSIVNPGEDVMFTIPVHNNGPSLAEDVDVKELLPPGLTIKDLSTTQGACTDSICQLGRLDVSQTVTLTVVAEVDPSLPPGTVISNTAALFADTSDPVTENNRATEPIAIRQSSTCRYRNGWLLQR